MKQITAILLILSLIGMALGGLSDSTGKRYIISKEHYWNGGLLVLAIFFEMFY